jgi:diguanylate cyclase (GGDEF)-like protein
MIVNFEEIIALLKHVPLFSGVALEHLDRHLRDARQSTLTTGQVLMSPGESHEKLIVILSGRLRVHSGALSNEPIAMFGAGESLGEISMLDDQISYAYLVADTDSTLLSIDFAAIWALVNDSHQAAINLLNILALRNPHSEQNFSDAERHLGYVGLNHVDELTGLYNSKWMYQIFGRQIYRCSRNHSLATMLMISIDRFKLYNDANGCLGGDQALRTVAQTILNCLRPNDQAARLHGKNFIIFLSNTPLLEGRNAADRLLSQVRSAHIVTPNGDALPGVTVSIGMTEVSENSTLDQAIEQTIQAVQRARDAGRNRISE